MPQTLLHWYYLRSDTKLSPTLFKGFGVPGFQNQRIRSFWWTSFRSFGITVKQRTNFSLFSYGCRQASVIEECAGAREPPLWCHLLNYLSSHLPHLLATMSISFFSSVTADGHGNIRPSFICCWPSLKKVPWSTLPIEVIQFKANVVKYTFGNACIEIRTHNCSSLQLQTWRRRYRKFYSTLLVGTVQPYIKLVAKYMHAFKYIVSLIRLKQNFDTVLRHQWTGDCKNAETGRNITLWTILGCTTRVLYRGRWLVYRSKNCLFLRLSCFSVPRSSL